MVKFIRYQKSWPIASFVSISEHQLYHRYDTESQRSGQNIECPDGCSRVSSLVSTTAQNFYDLSNLDWLVYFLFSVAPNWNARWLVIISTFNRRMILITLSCCSCICAIWFSRLAAAVSNVPLEWGDITTSYISYTFIYFVSLKIIFCLAQDQLLHACFWRWQSRCSRISAVYLRNYDCTSAHAWLSASSTLSTRPNLSSSSRKLCATWGFSSTVMCLRGLICVAYGVWMFCCVTTAPQHQTVTFSVRLCVPFAGRVAGHVTVVTSRLWQLAGPVASLRLVAPGAVWLLKTHLFIAEDRGA